MSRIERALRRMWRGEGGADTLALAGVTAPAGVAFGGGVRLRNALYDVGALRSRTVGMPVVSVGNLAVGGTGKTPVAAWVTRHLTSMGWKPALVIRGYGEDEIRLHRQWNPEVPVIRTPRRIDGARRARAEGRDVIVLDDGFQHRGIARDLDLVLLSPAHPLPARLLPRGPYRETFRALRRADYVLVTAKGDHEREDAQRLADGLSGIRPGLPVEVFPFRTGEWRALDGSAASGPSGPPPLVVTSVAEPEGFLHLVREERGEPVAHLRFPDHHPFDRSDVDRICEATGNGWVATTEKDAVKLLPFEDDLPQCRVLPLVPDPQHGLADRILGRLKRTETEEKHG